MDRYLDNTSPEPTSQTSLLQQNCYKTPDFTQFHSNYTTYQYPTPPSDNEDSNAAAAVLAYHSQATEISPSYYNSQTQANKTSGSSSSDDSQQATASTSRYKRRSRTTFTKSQVSFFFFKF